MRKVGGFAVAGIDPEFTGYSVEVECRSPPMSGSVRLAEEAAAGVHDRTSEVHRLSTAVLRQAIRCALCQAYKALRWRRKASRGAGGFGTSSKNGAQVALQTSGAPCQSKTGCRSYHRHHG